MKAVERLEEVLRREVLCPLSWKRANTDIKRV